MYNLTQLKQHTIAIILKAFNPSRVFIALMLVVILWLFPIVFPPKADAQPLYGGACGRTCNFGCCISGACSKCPEEDPDLPPTISGSVNCSQPGNNNWCIGALTLNFAAADPQGKEVIISGDVNGLEFACPAGNIACFVPITVEGNGVVNFFVDSATGLSASGSMTYQLDLSTPQLDGDLSGANGSNGWFISDVTFSASAADSISGLAALETYTDGGAWTAYNAPVTLSDGVHTVALRAYDYAGNLAETNQTINIDTLTPVLDSSVSGTAGLNGWYVSDTQVSATASDLGSGLFMLEVSTDGGAWTGYSAPVTLSDGVHTIQFRATDYAGNVTESTQTVKVDTITPTLNLSVSGIVGLNGWYTSITQVSSTSSDSGSGVAVIEAVADSGAWEPVNSLSLSDGLHAYQFKATDNAGNTTAIPIQNLKVDTIAPTIEMTKTLPLGEKVYYSLEDNGSGLFIYRAVIEDDDEKYKKIVWHNNVSGNKLEDDILWDGIFADGRKAEWGEYFITLKISDAAGNETMKAAVVRVNLLSAMQIIPPFIPPQASLATEPAPTTQSGSLLSTGFGGMNNGATGGITSSSFASAGGVHAAGGVTSVHTWTKTSDSTAPSIPQSAILWGTAATALVGATLADWKRKRDEEERRVRAESHSNSQSTYRKIARAYQASLDNFRAALVKGGYTAKAANALKSQVILSGIIPSAQKIIAERREKQIQANIAAAAYAQRKAAEEAARKAEAEKKRKAIEAQGLMAYYLGRKAGEILVTPLKKTSWLSNLWNTGSTFVEKNIAQPVVTWTQTKIVQPFNKYIYQPYIQPKINTKNIVSTLLTIALGVNGMQWVNSVASNPNLFLPAQSRAELLIEELRIKHPPAPETKTLNYMLSHPYEVFTTGADVLDTFTSIGTSYVDAIWQQNPLIQVQIKSLESLENSICTSILNQAWANRCTTAFYLPAGLAATPFDTALGVVNGFVVDPIEGILKQGALTYENLRDSFGVINALQEGGLESGLDFLKELAQRNLQILLNDKQLQSAIFFEILIVAAILAAPVAGGVVLGMTAKGLIDLDAAVVSANDKKSLIQLITSHGVRTTVVSSVLILALMTAGLGEKAIEFRSYQESLSPVGRAAFAELSLLEQTRIAELSIKLNIPPSTLEFYLTESARPGSSLANLPLTDAMRVSSLAEQSGKGVFILDYISKYGLDSALKDISPEALKLYVDLAKTPDSLFQQITPQEGLKVLSGEVVSIDPALAIDLVVELSRITGKNTWSSPFTGETYFSTSSPRAIAAKNQLIVEGVNSPNANALLKIIGKESVRGSGNRFQTGPYILKDSVTGLPKEIAGVEKGVYIQDSLNNGVRFFDIGEAYAELKEAGFTDDQLWTINQEAIRIAMESKIPVDFVFTDVDAMLEKYADSPDAAVPIRVREMRWIRDNAAEFGYVQEGNSWINDPNP